MRFNFFVIQGFNQTKNNFTTMFFRKTHIIILVLFTCTLLFSQEFPPVNGFYTKDYQAENQNWDITQSNTGFIYVANNKGLLEYNGATWKVYQTPNETIMRSVQYYDGKVFTGFYMDFGYWQKNSEGILNYTSLVEQDQIVMLEDEQIWSIIEIDGWMVFKSLQRIYLYNLESKTVKIINSETKINKLTKVNEIIYFQENKKGLFKIENGKPKLVSNDKILIENVLVEVFSKDGKLFFVTEENGFFYLEKGTVKKWNISSNQLLSNKTIYSAKQLKDNSIALGTISNGLINLKANGDLEYLVNQSSYLSNNTVLSIFEDRDRNIWLGLDNGIDCVNNTSPLRIYEKKSDFLGTVYTSVIYKENIYLGTNQGLFYRSLKSKEAFKFVKNTQGQVWNLKVINNILFCGHDSGVFVIDTNIAKIIFDKQGTWNMIHVDTNKIVLGTYEGLYTLKKEDNSWVYHKKIEGFDNSSKYVVQLNENQFFVNHEYKGVFKLTVDKNFEKVIKNEKETSLEKGIHSSIINYRGNILYANRKGIYKYNTKRNTFERDPLYSNLVSDDNFISAKLVHNDSNDKLWFFTKNYIKYLTPGKLSDKPSISQIQISESIPKATSGYENIIHINNNIYLIGTSSGYLQIDLKSLEETKDFKTYINKIQSYETDGPKKKLNLENSVALDYNNNNLEIFFSVPNFQKSLTTTYQYYLDGFNKSWSAPSKNHSVLFENLSYGKYTFKVRGIVGSVVSSNIATYSFTINRPWYLSNLFITIYVLLSLFAFYVVHVLSKRFYKKQREDLLDKAKKEAELNELASTQEIIKLNNENLRKDIENKNKELATSTMNSIKKNEFLNTIKTELSNGGEKSIAKVIKIIDKNLNNTDDWKMFQEAFNNADKDFLKKVKDKHSNLTPNDLRLCAYLRLNLSSKEIAPLLNISPRSVEVKRYRLRKKMNLDHDANLTTYILEI